MNSLFLLSLVGFLAASEIELSEEIIKLESDRPSKFYINMFYDLIIYKNKQDTKWKCTSTWYLGVTEQNNYFLRNENRTIHNVIFPVYWYDHLYPDFNYIATRDPNPPYDFEWLESETVNLTEYCEEFVPPNGFEAHYNTAYLIKLSNEYKITSETVKLIWPFSGRFDDYVKGRSKRIQFATIGNYNNTSSATITEIYSVKQKYTENVAIEITNQTTKSTLIERPRESESTSSFHAVNHMIRGELSDELDLGIASIKATLEEKVEENSGSSNGFERQCVNNCITTGSTDQLLNANRTESSREIEYTLTRQIEIKPFTHMKMVSFINWVNNIHIRFEVRRVITGTGPTLKGSALPWRVDKMDLNERELLKMIKLKYSCDFLIGVGHIRGSFAVDTSFMAFSEEIKH